MPNSVTITSVCLECKSIRNHTFSLSLRERNRFFSSSSALSLASSAFFTYKKYGYVGQQVLYSYTIPPHKEVSLTSPPASPTNSTLLDRVTSPVEQAYNSSENSTKAILVIGIPYLSCSITAAIFLCVIADPQIPLGNSNQYLVFLFLKYSIHIHLIYQSKIKSIEILGELSTLEEIMATIDFFSRKIPVYYLSTTYLLSNPVLKYVMAYNSHHAMVLK